MASLVYQLYYCGRHLWWCHLVVILTWLGQVCSQSTQQQSGCSFMDDQSVLNIEVVRGTHNTPCPSVNDFQEQFKATEDSLAEMSYDMMQLQTKVLQLMDTSLNMTLELAKLTEELRATQYALQTIDTALVDCPAGYRVHSPTLKSCFMFVSRPLSWYEAETFCMSTRGHLLSIDEQAEQDFLVSYIHSSNTLPGNSFWTGGNSIVDDNLWYWAGSNRQVNYSHWVPNPSVYAQADPFNLNANEKCLFIFHQLNYKWAYDYCFNSHYFICEYQLI